MREFVILQQTHIIGEIWVFTGLPCYFVGLEDWSSLFDLWVWLRILHHLLIYLPSNNMCRFENLSPHFFFVKSAEEKQKLHYHLPFLVRGSGSTYLVLFTIHGVVNFNISPFQSKKITQIKTIKSWGMSIKRNLVWGSSPKWAVVVGGGFHIT